MGFTISKNQGSGRTVITVTPEEKNATDKDIVQILTVEAVDGSTGGNQPHENRPPYYVLAYVMKVR